MCSCLYSFWPFKNFTDDEDFTIPEQIGACSTWPDWEQKQKEIKINQGTPLRWCIGVSFWEGWDVFRRRERNLVWYETWHGYRFISILLVAERSTRRIFGYFFPFILERGRKSILYDLTYTLFQLISYVLKISIYLMFGHFLNYYIVD